MTFTSKRYFNYCTTIRCYRTRIGCDWPLINFKTSLLFSSFTFLDILLHIFCFFFTSFFGISGNRSSDIVGGLKFSLSFFLNIGNKFVSKLIISIIKDAVVEFEQTLIFDLEASCFSLVKLNRTKVHIFERSHRIATENRIDSNIYRYYFCYL